MYVHLLAYRRTYYTYEARLALEVVVFGGEREERRQRGGAPAKGEEGGFG